MLHYTLLEDDPYAVEIYYIFTEIARVCLKKICFFSPGDVF